MLRQNSIRARFGAALFVLTLPLAANDYYVDGLRGTDVTTGGSATQPWKSLPYALAQIPAPSGTTVHRLLVIGGQDYNVATTMTLRDRVHIVGQGAARPRLVAAANAVVFALDPRIPSTDMLVANVACSGGSVAASLSTSTTAQDCTFIDCAFSGQSKASVDGTIGGNTRVRLSSCSFEQVEKGVDLGANSAGLAVVVIDGCSFERSKLEAVNVATRDSGQARVVVVTSRFEGCNRGVQLNSRGNGSLEAQVERCAFRRGSFGAIEATASTKIALRVTESTMLGNDRGIVVDSLGAGFALYTLTLEDNLITDCTYAGLSLNIDGQPVSPPTWNIRCSRNRYERCEENYVVRLGAFVYGVFVSDGEISRRSNGAGMNFTVAAPSPQLNCTVQNAIVTEAARRGLSVAGLGVLQGRFLTLADHQGPAIDLFAGGKLDLDHSVLDNAYAPELRTGTGQLTMRYTSSRSALYPGVGNLMADPQLLRPHYKLSAASPCIDAGQANVATPPLDYEGDARVLTTKTARVDLGADEYSPVGSTRSFGAPGFGHQNGLLPKIELLSTDARIGTRVRLGLQGAVDRRGAAAPAAVLLFGVGERLPVIDLAAAGAPGNVVYSDPLFFGAAVGIDAVGRASFDLNIPSQPSLIGSVSAAQWLVVDRGANALGLVTSDSYRITIGQ